MENNKVIIKGLLEFYPKFNRDYSWINSLFQLGVGFLSHIIMGIITLIGLILVYDFIKTNKHIGNILNAAFIFIISGAICSLVDKIFWGGSLDYVYLVGFFIFDLKDVYASTFVALTILAMIKNFERFKNIDEKKTIKEFWSFFKIKYLRMGKNIDKLENNDI